MTLSISSSSSEAGSVRPSSSTGSFSGLGSHPKESSEEKFDRIVNEWPKNTSCPLRTEKFNLVWRGLDKLNKDVGRAIELQINRKNAQYIIQDEIRHLRKYISAESRSPESRDFMDEAIKQLKKVVSLEKNIMLRDELIVSMEQKEVKEVKHLLIDMALEIQQNEQLKKEKRDYKHASTQVRAPTTERPTRSLKSVPERPVAKEATRVPGAWDRDDSGGLPFSWYIIFVMGVTIMFLVNRISELR